jgi:hypothetical protein
MMKASRILEEERESMVKERKVRMEWPLLRIVTVLFALLLFAASAHALSGRDIYEKVHAVRTKALDQTLEATMILYDRGGGRRSRTLVEYGRKSAAEAYKVLVVFETPPDLRGVGFLVHARSFADRDLWAYFPAFKRIRRIPTSAQDDSFFGTDFSYDDFGGPSNLGDYDFEMLREEPVDGKPCDVVVVTPKIHRKYTRYIAWVAKDLWIQLRVEYFQGETLYREGSFTDVRVIDGIPTSFKGFMKNMKTGHKTAYTLERVEYHTHHPDTLFTQRALEREGE